MEIYFQFQVIFRIHSFYISEILWQNLIEQKTSQCCIDRSGNSCSIRSLLGNSYMNLGMKRNDPILVCQDCFIHRLEEFAFSKITRSLLGQIVDTENHILGRNGYRATIRRL